MGTQETVRYHGTLALESFHLQFSFLNDLVDLSVIY